MAYQIAFDLEENATQDFLQQVLNTLPEPAAKNEADMDTDNTVWFNLNLLKLDYIKFF